MADFASRSCTAFAGPRRMASGPLAEVALAVNAAEPSGLAVLVFDDATGRVVDLDLRGEPAEILARLAERTTEGVGVGETKRRASEGEPRGRGRPRLGVVAREITLLPRHWDWLAAQPGGASQALRRLVDEARRADGGQAGRRASQEAAYRFMSAMAGDLAGFEEAARALFAGDAGGFERNVGQWPQDVAAYARRLAADTLERRK